MCAAPSSSTRLCVWRADLLTSFESSSYSSTCFGSVGHIFPVWPPEAAEVAVILVLVNPEAWHQTCLVRSGLGQECFGWWTLMLKEVALQFVDKKEGEEEGLLDDR
jgi:hypothetical protein